MPTPLARTDDLHEGLLCDQRHLDAGSGGLSQDTYNTSSRSHMGRRTRYERLAAGVALLAILLGGCSGDDSGSEASGGGGSGDRLAVSSGGEEIDPANADVSIVNFAFEDAEFTTSAGSTVVWVNEGSAPHTVTSDDFDSGTIRTERGFSHEFAEPGEYAYWCNNHPGMEGTIIVE